MDLAYLNTVIHPYYKLAYIKMAWGGPEEQAREQECGNPTAKDWQDEALKIVEKAMAEYWQESSRSTVQAGRNTDQSNGTTVSRTLDMEAVRESDFDRHRRTLITQSATDNTGGWAAELRRYLADLPADVEKHSDIVKWWQVRGSVVSTAYSILIRYLRTMLNRFRRSHVLPKTFVPFQQHLSRASDSFPQGLR